MAEEYGEAGRTVLRHVQPSGRGTQSEHELAAKRAAVASIERRIDHNENVRRSAARKRLAANLGSVAVGLAVLGGIGYYFTHGEGLESWKRLRGMAGADSGKAAAEADGPAEAPVDAAEKKYRDRYAAVASEFAQGELAKWKNAPGELKLKNAPAGTVYHALVPRGGKFGLYEIKAGGLVSELSPFGRPTLLTMGDFKKACGGKPYFVASGGRVFMCGDGDLKMMDELRKALVPQ